MNEGGGFGVAAGAVLAMGRAAAEAREAGAAYGRIQQVPIGAIQIPISAGAGSYDMPDLLSVRAGYMWSVRRLTASGFTAGTVAVWKGGVIIAGANIGGEPLPGFPAAGVNTLGRGEALLDQGDRLIFTAAGITLAAGFAGVQVNGSADCFERWYLPEYLD